MFQSPQMMIALRLDELAQVRKETLEKADLRCLTMRARRTRGPIDACHRELAEARLEVAAFAVELGGAEARHDLRSTLGVEPDAGVAFFGRGVEEPVRLSRRTHPLRNIVELCLDVLQAHDVPGLGASEPARKALAFRRADAVDVEGNDAHRRRGGFGRSAECTRSAGGKIPAMNGFRRDFLAFALARDVLRFGQFVTKAGRQTPYFFNAGLFNDGESLRRLGQF